MADIARLGVEIDPAGANAGIASVRRGLRGMATSAKTSVQGVQRQFNSLKKDLTSLKTLVATVFTGFALREVIGTTRAFGLAISDLQAITGAAGEDLEFLEAKARAFGAATTLSATESAIAIKLIASAKPDLLENAEALAAVTKEAISLSEASGVDLPNAANALGLSLNQFEEDATQASRFINVLAAGAKFGASEIADTSAAIEKAGTVANVAGVSFEELNSLIQVLAQNGIKSSIAGTQLRGVLLSLAEEGEEFSIKQHGLNEVLRRIAPIVEDGANAVKFFGRENVAAATILAKNAENAEELTNKLTGTTTAYEQQAIRVDNLDGDLKSLGSTYEEFILKIGRSNDAELRGLVQALRDAVIEAGNLVDNIDMVGAALAETIPVSVNNFKASMAKAQAAITGQIHIGLDGIEFQTADGKPISEAFAAIDKARTETNARIHEEFKEQLAERRRLAELQKENARLANLEAMRPVMGLPLLTDKSSVFDGFGQASKPEIPVSASFVFDSQYSDLKDSTGNTFAPDDLFSKVFPEMSKLTVPTKVDMSAFEEGSQLVNELRTPIEVYNDEVERLYTLHEKGAISTETFNRGLLSSGQALIEARSEVQDTNSVVEDLGLTFTSSFEQAVLQGEKLSDVLKNLGRDLAALAARQLITKPLFSFLTTAFLPGIPGLGAAHGTSFTIGGHGGTDSQYVGFMGTPGEHVEVGARSNMNKNRNQGMHVTFAIDARGADQSVEARILTIVERRMIPQAIQAAQQGTINYLSSPKGFRGTI